MDYLSIVKLLDPILEAGPLLLVFLAFTLIGLAARRSFVRAVRAGLMITAGFGGVYILVGYFLSELAPAAEAVALRFGGALPYTDNGWRAFYSFAFAWPATYGVVALCLLVNLVMLLFSMTDTLNLNIRDYWLTGLAAMILSLLSGSLAAGLIFAAFLVWASLMLSDFFAQRGYGTALGLPGLTLFLGLGTLWSVFSHYLGLLLDKAGIEPEPQQNPARVHQGFLGEPALLGAILGLLLGMGAGYYWVDTTLLVISLAIALVLLPVMTDILKKALADLHDESGVILVIGRSRRQIHIGFDPSVAAGEPAILTAAVLMVPITLVMSLVIPGAMSMPFADLASLMLFWVFAAVPQRFNLPRTLVICTLMTLFGIFASARGVAYWSDLVARNAGVTAPQGMGITSWFNHLSPEMLTAGLLGENFEILGLNGIILVCAVGVLVTAIFRLNYLRKQKAGAGQSEAVEQQPFIRIE